MRLIGYIRVSTASQEDNTSLAEQRRRIEAYCCAFGHELVAVFEEVGSGKDAESRPQLQAALKTVRESVDGIIAAKLDRLARNTRDVLELVEDTLQPANKALILLDLQVDTSTPTGRMILTVMAAVAQLERDVINERTQGGRKAKAGAGGYAYGSPAFGQVAIGGALVEDEDEQVIIDIIRRHHQSGKSTVQIAAWLNEHGHTTKRGQQWFPAQVGRVLKRLGKG
jgi:site-specific DNA recombinase